MLLAASRINQTKEYQPTTIQPSAINFRPIKQQPEGSVQYVAIIETGEELVIRPDSESDSESEAETHEELYEQGKVYAPLVVSPKKTPDIFSIGEDPIKTFYIGSITVVGLFILYRMLSK